MASGADAAGNLAWRELAASWLRATGWASGNPRTDFIALGRGVLPLICGDVIRPSLSWLLDPETPKNLAAEMARSRDPGGFAALAALARTDPASAATKDLAARRIATILAAKGGMIADTTVGDCLELLGALTAGSGGSNTSPYFYQLLHALGVFPATAPPTVRAFRTPGQLTAEQLIDRYPLACQPIRALLIDYLRERQPAVDHATLRSLSRALAGLFWRDLERHHPGISSLRLAPGVAAAWKQRVTVKTLRTADPAGQVTESAVPRHDGMNTLAMVRAFYLDIAQWAADDPARWGPWAVPCPIRDEEMSRKKERSHRKSRMDQRTRERLPVLPALAATVDAARERAAQILQAALAAPPGTEFTAAGQTLRQAAMTRKATSARAWAEDPATGKRRDLTLEEHRAFWTWAAVEVFRLTGIRIEELTELSHHSFVQYRQPATSELIPLLQIAPSKTDQERLLVISPELADVLSAIIGRIRDSDGTVPLVVGLRHPRTRLEPADAAAVPAPDRRRAPAADCTCHPCPAQHRAGRRRAHRRQRETAELHPPRFPQAIHHRCRDERHAAAHRPARWPGTATSTRPWDTRRSIPKKSSTRTGHSSPAAALPVPARNTGFPATRNGRSSSATSNAAGSRWATAGEPTGPAAFMNIAASDVPFSGFSQISGPVWWISATT